jgi:5'-nucleotidase
MRVLITNDDGIDSPGIAALARVAVELGLDVVVAAPAWNSSGASASLTGVSADGRLIIQERHLDGVEGAVALGVEAAPAMIVRAGVRGGFGPAPDLVLSGINDGPNTGHAVLHSGTVGAALTAATHGCRAVAFSLGLAAQPDFRAAAHVARTVIPWALHAPAPLTLNVNVPSGAPEDVRGLREAPLASFGAVQTNVTELGRGYVGVSFAEIDPSGEPGSDATLLANGYATLTPLSPVCEATGVDLGGLLGDTEGGPATSSR